jgi:hypothetical protein
LDLTAVASCLFSTACWPAVVQAKKIEVSTIDQIEAKPKFKGNGMLAMNGGGGGKRIRGNRAMCMKDFDLNCC